MTFSFTQWNDIDLLELLALCKRQHHWIEGRETTKERPTHCLRLWTEDLEEIMQALKFYREHK